MFTRLREITDAAVRGGWVAALWQKTTSVWLIRVSYAQESWVPAMYTSLTS
ncbi:UNVERIFIED_CONTAM: hypothetical protein DES50_11111 [Williamsia faeni]